MKKLLFISLVLVPALLFAQPPQPPKPTQKYLIKAGKLFDSESGQFKTGMDILVSGEVIDGVKADKDVTADEKNAYKLVDLSAYTVMPGLIDCHTHILNKEQLHPGNDLPGLDMEKMLTMYGDAYRAIYGSVKAKGYLESGITAVQDLGNSGKFADIALRRAIGEGLVIGPRMRCAGQGLASEGGQLPDLIYQHRDIVNDEYRIVLNPYDAIQAVRENVTQGADVIKIYSNNTPNKTALSVEEIQAIVKEAHRYGLRVTAHATDNQAVYNATVAGVDGIEHCYQVADSTLALMAKKKVIMVPTDGDNDYYTAVIRILYPDNKEILNKIPMIRKRSADRLKRAMKAGVTIASGADDYLDVAWPFGQPSVHNIIGYAEDGVPIPQVLQFATINASKQLAWDKDIGQIKKGFLADIIAVDSNVDTDIRAILNVHFVMKGGVVYVNK